MINKSSKDDANMTNSEYDKLMALTKVFVKENINLPRNGEFETYDLESRESRDKFYLDIDRRGEGLNCQNLNCKTDMLLQNSLLSELI